MAADFWGSRAGVILLVLAVWAGIVAARVSGPSDLYDKEQPRTTSYTADMVESGHWVLPEDTFGIPATKPPLYNWLTVPFVEAWGFAEWTLKMPSVIASLGVAILLVAFAGRMLRMGGPGSLACGPGDRLAVGALAAMLWLACPVTVKLLYVARPDMLLTLFLTMAWMAATMMAREGGSARASGGVRAAIFWGGVLGASMTKSVLGFFGLAYLVLAAVLIGGKMWWRVLLRSGWWWGLPLVVGFVGWWTAAAYRMNPEFVKVVLVDREVMNRLGGWKVITTFFNGPAYILTRFLPWSLLAAAGVWMAARGESGAVQGAQASDGTAWRRWTEHPLAPAIIWIGMILAVFSFAATKRPDRYAPVYPQMAIMAAYVVVAAARRWKGGEAWRKGAVMVMGAAAAIVVGLCLQNQFFSEGAKRHYGEHVIAFARDVKRVAGNDPILFLDGEQTPVETLLGHMQADPPAAETLRAAKWCVRFFDPAAGGEKPAVISEPIAQIDGRADGRLGLFKLSPGEGAAAFSRAEALPMIYANSENVEAHTDGSRAKWLQFWRVHTERGEKTR